MEVGVVRLSPNNQLRHATCSSTIHRGLSFDLLDVIMWFFPPENVKVHFTLSPIKCAQTHPLEMFVKPLIKGYLYN